MENQKTTTAVRGVTARDLFQKSDRRVIQEIVTDQVKVIDAHINTAHGSGFSEITYELPTNFQINNMNKADAQTMIYSEILMIYKKPEPEGKGFENVYVDIGIKSVMRISWLNGMDEDERERRLQFINGCRAAKPRGNKRGGH